ncbi:MAG: glycosyltransferase family 39 protein [Nitrospirota bacterium]
MYVKLQLMGKKKSKKKGQPTNKSRKDNISTSTQQRGKPPFSLFSISRDKIILISILVISVVLRLVYLFQIKGNDPNFLHFSGTDASSYDGLANLVLNGDLPKSPYSFNPLYFYFLAMVYLIVGHSPFNAVLVQILVGCGSYLLVYLIAKRIFNQSVGIIAAGLCAFYGIFMVYETSILTVVLDTFLLLLSTLLLLKSIKKDSIKWYFITGIVIGLSTLSRATTLFVLPFLLLWVLIVSGLKKRFIVATLFIILGTAAAISPVTIRNYIYSGKFILLTTSGPITFWAGNNEDSEGIYYIPPYADNLKGKEDEGFWTRDALRFIKEKPHKYLWLLSQKFTLFWSGSEIPDNDIVYSRFKKYSPLLRLMLPFGLIASLGAMGMLLSLMRLNKNVFLLFFVLLGYMSAILLFFVMARFRVPVVPYLTLFAGYTIFYWYEKIKAKRYKPLVISFSIFCIIYSLVNFNTFWGWTYPLNQPNGFCIEKRYGYLIRDNSGDWHGDKSGGLDSPDKAIKKELMITSDLSKVKAAGLGLYYSANDKGYLLININGHDLPKISCAYITYGQFTRTASIELNPFLLKKGTNTITFKVTEGANVQLLIDDYYNFGRSYFSNDGINFEKLNGEYLAHLELKEKLIGGKDK